MDICLNIYNKMVGMRWKFKIGFLKKYKLVYKLKYILSEINELIYFKNY